jgi:Na+/H+-translocating membrane pyrophosphatase
VYHQLAIVRLITLFKYCSPVQDVADSCRTGAATNVIFGLALGYKSVIIPIFSIAIAIYVSFSLAAMYGIAVAALGMLSTIATGLAIDAYGPISDNAGGIAEMAGMSHEIRERTDALDAAGNTTAAIGKVISFSSFSSTSSSSSSPLDNTLSLSLSLTLFLIKFSAPDFINMIYDVIMR